MSASTNHHTLFVGVGSPHGDDQIGWRIADALVDDVSLDVAVRKVSVPTSLLDLLDGVERLVLCDACRGNGEAGSLQRFEWRLAAGQNTSTVIPALARMRTSGSHAFGLPAVLDLAHRLGRLPPQVVVWGIEGRTFDPGDELSPELLDRLPTIVATIRNELSHARSLTDTIVVEPGGTVTG